MSPMLYYSSKHKSMRINSNMKNKTFIDSIKCAFSGLFYALKTEKNFKYYFVIASIFFIINCLCHISLMGHIAFLIVCGGVFSAEFINTSIEHLANALTTSVSDKIRIVKDIAATGVLIWGFVFFIMESIFIIRVIL